MTLRARLAAEGILVAPGVYDGLTAAIAADAGFEALYLSGAAVAYTAGRDFPERLLSLATMAVPHSGRFLSEVHRYPRQLRLSWYMGFFQLRGIADRVVQRKQFAFLRKLWRDWSPGCHGA